LNDGKAGQFAADGIIELNAAPRPFAVDRAEIDTPVPMDVVEIARRAEIVVTADVAATEIERGVGNGDRFGVGALGNFDDVGGTGRPLLTKV